MQSIALDDLPLVGAFHLDPTRNGVIPRRLPSWTKAQIVDPAVEVMVTMPAGVRIEMHTGARELEIDVMLTALQILDKRPLEAIFDLVVDGERRSSVTIDDRTIIHVEPRTMSLDFEIGKPATVRLDLPGDAASVVELWLPHAHVVELRDARISDGATVRPAARARRRWIHHGSSISHCTETPHPTDTWPAIAARLADVDLLDLAFAGQCHLDQYVARTIRDTRADLISVKAGINVINADSMRERTFVAALHGFLDTVRDGHPTTPLLVVTPIICPVAEDHPGPTLLREDGKVHVVERSAELFVGSLTLQRVRTVVGEIVQSRQRQGDSALFLLDGNALFGDDDVADLPDGLHPNADGYRRMGQRFHSEAFTGDGVFAS